MSDTPYDPDERFSLEEDPEDVLRKMLNGDDEEETEVPEDGAT